MKTTRQEAAERINGTIHGQYVTYYDDNTRRSYRNPVADLDYLAELIDSDDKDISRDAYSHWCAGTTSEELASVGDTMIEVDASGGQGHCWRTAVDVPADIIEEIAAEINDGDKGECSDYTASNGQHYRW